MLRSVSHCFIILIKYLNKQIRKEGLIFDSQLTEVGCVAFTSTDDEEGIAKEYSHCSTARKQKEKQRR